MLNINHAQNYDFCKVLADYSRFSYEELMPLFMQYKTIDGLIKAIEYADTFNVSLEYACLNVIPIKKEII